MRAVVDQQTTADELLEQPGRFETLLTAMRAGSPEAAQEIVDTYGPHIRAVIKRQLNDSLRSLFDSEDFLQSAWKSLIRMEPDKVDEIHDPKQLVGLMITIAARKVIDEYRKRTHPACNVRRRRDLEDSEVLAALAKLAGVNTPSQICMEREKHDFYRQRWENLVNQQTERDQRIVNLRLRGLEFDEIAQAEEVSSRHARRIMKKLLERLTAPDRHLKRQKPDSEESA